MEKELRKFKDIIKQVLVGKDIEVFYSKNESEIGIRGYCVEDRANILIIKTPSGEKKIIKKNAWFLIYTNSHKILVPGTKIVGKIEKRIKKIH